MENKATAEREIRGLLGALSVFKLKQGTILTSDEHTDIERDGKKISIRPLWLFALEPAK